MSRVTDAPTPLLYRRKFKLKPNIESSSPCSSFKRLVPGAFKRGFDRINLHRPTLYSVLHPSFRMIVSIALFNPVYSHIAAGTRV
jgi:hypothetical protein